MRWEERPSKTVVHLDGENVSATLKLPKCIVRINGKKYKLKRQCLTEVSFYFMNRHGGAIRFYRSSFSRREYLMEYDPRGIPEEHIFIEAVYSGRSALRKNETEDLSSILSALRL